MGSLEVIASGYQDMGGRLKGEPPPGRGYRR